MLGLQSTQTSSRVSVCFLNDCVFSLDHARLDSVTQTVILIKTVDGNLNLPYSIMQWVILMKTVDGNLKLPYSIMQPVILIKTGLISARASSSALRLFGKDCMIPAHWTDTIYLNWHGINAFDDSWSGLPFCGWHWTVSSRKGDDLVRTACVLEQQSFVVSQSYWYTPKT